MANKRGRQHHQRKVDAEADSRFSVLNDMRDMRPNGFRGEHVRGLPGHKEIAQRGALTVMLPLTVSSW